jgi:hypothetical protein
MRWLALALSLALSPWPAAAQAPSIEAEEARLAAPDPAEREAAVVALRTLPASAAEAIGQRLRALARRPIPEDRAETILHAFRRATGSRRADDVVDVADGVAAVLATSRDEPTRQIAALVLLTRALEGHGTPASLAIALEAFRVPGDAFVVEGRRFTARVGPRAAGTVLRSLGHPDPRVREWARWSMQHLGLDAPGSFVRAASPSVLADVLRAFGQARLMDAMPILASLVDAPQRIVREAAFEGLAAYGSNAIWTLREAYRLHADEDAELSWGAERTLEALREAVERNRLAAAEEALAEAEARLAEGDAARAAELADVVLLSRPELGSAEVARIYLAAGEASLAARDARTAARHLARAERLARLGGDAALLRRAEGLVTYVEAETRLAAGTLDVDAYARAAAAVPDDPRLAAIAASYAEPEAPPDRSLPLALAALLFLAGAILLVRPRIERSRASTPPPPEREAAVTAPG